MGSLVAHRRYCPVKSKVAIAIGALAVTTCLLGLACATLTSSSDMKGGAWCSISADHQLICAFPASSGSEIALYDLNTKAKTQSFRVDKLPILRAYLIDDMWLYEARCSTPKNRSTIQVFSQQYGSASPPALLLPPDETMRTGLAVVEGAPVYMKSSNYAGALGGMPWGPPFSVCKIVDGSEVLVAQTTSVQYGAASGIQPLYPYAQSNTQETSRVVLQDIDKKSARDLFMDAHIVSIAVSPNRKEIAWIGKNPNQPSTINIENLDSGSTVSTNLEGRATQVLYDSDSVVYVITQSSRRNDVKLLKFSDGKIVTIMPLIE